MSHYNEQVLVVSVTEFYGFVIPKTVVTVNNGLELLSEARTEFGIGNKHVDDALAAVGNSTAIEDEEHTLAPKRDFRWERAGMAQMN